MYIKEVTLHNFKSIEDLKLTFDGFYIDITGKNTTGKTTLLQAISLLSNSSGFIRTKLKDFLSIGKNSSDISILYYSNADNKEHRLSCSINEKRKKYNLDSKNVTSFESILKLIPLTLYFDPEDAFFFQDEPEPRRRLIDDVLSSIDEDYDYSLMMYEKYLQGRNDSFMRNDDEEIIRLYRNMLIIHSYSIVQARKSFIEKLSPFVSEVYNKLFDDGDKKLKLAYHTTCSNSDDKELYKKQTLQLFKKRYDDELAYRRTLFGPQNDDLLCTINGIDIADCGSQAENKFASLSLKISLLNMLKEYCIEKPILLLDDIASDLDDKRYSALLNYLESFSQQIIITESGVSKVKDNYKVYNTENWR